MAEGKERGREGKVLWVGEGSAGLLLTRGATGTGNATSENVRQSARNDRPLDLHQFRGFSSTFKRDEKIRKRMDYPDYQFLTISKVSSP